MKTHFSLPSFWLVSAFCLLAIGSQSADPSCTKSTRFVSSLFRVQGLVGSAGDIDSDGYSDLLLVGASDTTGTLAVVSGRTKDVIYYIDEGGAARSVGDLNNDGIPDIAVGHGLADENGFASGRVDVFSGVDGVLLYSIDGAAGWEFFGVVLAKLGDVNGDNRADFLVGSMWFGDVVTHEGKVTAISGIDGSEIYTVEGDSTALQLGHSIAALGDVDDDGIPDFAAGGYFGRVVRVFSGVDGALIRELVDPQGVDTSRFGWGLSRAGDLDGDGVEDLLVGSPFTEISVHESKIHVYSGKTGEALFDMLPTGLQHDFGQRLAGGEDLDGDEIADIAVLAGPSHERILQIFSGADQSLIYADTGDLFGLNFRMGPAMAGDINGDCLSDVIVGGGVGEYLIYSLSNLCARSASCTGCCNMPGDANNDQSMNIADVTFLISRIFAGGAAPVCSAEGDVNADFGVNIVDITFLIARIFAGGDPPLCGQTL